jgi:hypothetical protein
MWHEDLPWLSEMGQLSLRANISEAAFDHAEQQT